MNFTKPLQLHVIDDEPMFSWILSEVLKTEFKGAVVSTYSDGLDFQNRAKAEELAKSRNVIISDYNMPNGCAATVFNALDNLFKAGVEAGDTAFIGVSGDDTDCPHRKELASKLVSAESPWHKVHIDYISKPFENKFLCGKIVALTVNSAPPPSSSNPSAAAAH